MKMDPRQGPPPGAVPIIGGPKQIAIQVSQLCVECFPQKAQPGIFIKDGNSLCGECFGKIKDHETAEQN
jgi:hypothetical protein